MCAYKSKVASILALLLVLCSHRMDVMAKVSGIADWGLCNNGLQEEDPYHGYECVNERDVKKTEICDPRSIPISDCLQYSLQLNGSSSMDIDKLQIAFNTIDENKYIRRLYITYPRTAFDDIAPILDEYLMKRPILFVRNESFPWQSTQELFLILDKYHHGFDRRLNLLGAVNYPDANTCSVAALHISRTNCIHPGYASAVSMYYEEARDHPFAPLGIYVSRSNTLMDGGAFIGGGDHCPYLNRWNCAFLPSTSCPFPSNITDCRNVHFQDFCVHKIPDTERFALIYYKGNYLRRSTPLYYEMKHAMKQPLSPVQQKLAAEPDVDNGGPQFRHIHPKVVSNSSFDSSAVISFIGLDHGYRHGHHNHSSQHHHNKRFFTRTPEKETHLHTYRPMIREAFEAIYQGLYFLRPTIRYRALIGKELRHFAIENDIHDLYGYYRQYRDEQIKELKKLDGNGMYSAKEATGYKFPKNETESAIVRQQVNATNSGMRRRLHISGQGKSHRNLRTDNEDSPFRCVAVHMRRGDRILKNLNESAMRQYCLDNPNNPAALDKGCGSIPFQFISLANITHAASTLVDISVVNNLVVLTEDDEWIVQEVEKLKQSDSPWKVNLLLGPWNEDRNFEMSGERWQHYGRMGLQAGVHFLTSMQVIRNCEAFVGHFGSAATHIFYVNMCVQHGVNMQRHAACPPVFDLRGLRTLGSE